MGATAKTLDFTGVPEGGAEFRPRRREEGDYYAHIVKVDDHKAKSGSDTWLFTIKVDGDPRSAYPYYVGTDDNQLWKVRALFVACGVPVPSKRVKADPNKLVGKALGLALEDDEYEGRVKSAIVATFPVDDITDAMNEAGKAAAKGKARSAEDDDIEDDEEDEPPARKPKKAAAKRKTEPEDDDEDDDDEEEEPPVKKKSAAKKGKKRPVADDDDDDELDLDDL